MQPSVCQDSGGPHQLGGRRHHSLQPIPHRHRATHRHQGGHLPGHTQLVPSPEGWAGSVAGLLGLPVLSKSLLFRAHSSQSSCLKAESNPGVSERTGLGLPKGTMSQRPEPQSACCWGHHTSLSGEGEDSLGQRRVPGPGGLQREGAAQRLEQPTPRLWKPCPLRQGAALPRPLHPAQMPILVPSARYLFHLLSTDVLTCREK